MPRVSGQHDKNQLLTSVGQAVRQRRKALKMSQEALSDLAEVDRSHMGKIERGERNVTLLNVAKIAEALGCRPSDLLTEAGH
jgi:transcriptional regulator with XRE-family HTH domain